MLTMFTMFTMFTMLTMQSKHKGIQNKWQFRLTQRHQQIVQEQS